MGKLTKDEVINFTIRAAINFISELLATGALVFIACMSCVLGFGHHNRDGMLELAVGAAIVTGVEIGAHISGGYVNPIFTITAVVFKKISIPMAFVYVLGELCGSLIGFGLIKALTPSEVMDVEQPHGLCTTVPNPDISLVQAFFVEFFASTFLVLLACSQWDPRNASLGTISLKLGFAVLSLVYATGPYTGGSMNPARSFGPAVWNNCWEDHWIYWIAPSTASLLWSFLYYKVFVERAPRKEEMQEVSVNRNGGG